MVKEKHPVVPGNTMTLVLCSVKLSCISEQPVVVEEEPKITSFTVPIKQVEKQTKSLIRTLDSLVVVIASGNSSWKLLMNFEWRANQD